MKTKFGILKIRLIVSLDLKWPGGRTVKSNKMKPQMKLNPIG